MQLLVMLSLPALWTMTTRIVLMRWCRDGHLEGLCRIHCRSTGCRSGRHDLFWERRSQCSASYMTLGMSSHDDQVWALTPDGMTKWQYLTREFDKQFDRDDLLV